MGKSHGIPEIISGPAREFKKSTFQGHATIVESLEHVEEIKEKLKNSPYFEKATQMPCAYRVLTGDEVTEQAENGSEVGAGDKLMYLLQRWEVHNLMLIVTRHDRSLCGDLVGVFRYKHILECAKAVLEKCFLQQLNPEEAAELEVEQRIEEPKEEEKNVVLMSPETVKFPENHIPTSDGSGRAVPKQGRINHFLSSPTSGVVPSEQDALKSEADKLPVIHTSSNSGLKQLNLTRDDLSMLKSLRKPPKELHLVLVCIGILLKVKDVTWAGCKQMLSSNSFCTELLALKPKKLQRKQINAVRSILQTPGFTAKNIQSKTVAGANLLRYVQTLVQRYDLIHLGLEKKITTKAVSQHQHDPVLTSYYSSSKISQPNLVETFAPEPAPPPRKPKYEQLISLDEKNQEAVIIDRGRMLLKS